MALITMWETTKAFLAVIGVALIALAAISLMLGDRH